MRLSLPAYVSSTSASRPRASNIGSDAVNKDPDYSAAYCILETNTGLEGYGLTFTLGRGKTCARWPWSTLARFVKGRTLASLTTDMAAFCRQLTDDSQFRWLGPEKGVIHLATGALINAVWDLYARAEKKPLWRLLGSMEPEQILSAMEFRYIDDALTREEAREILEAATAQARRSALPCWRVRAIRLIRRRWAGLASAMKRFAGYAAKRSRRAGPSSS